VKLLRKAVSGIMLTLLLIGTLTAALNIGAHIVAHGDPNNYEPSDATKAVIDLRYEENVTDPSPITNGVSSICALGVPGPLWAVNSVPVPAVAGDDDTTPCPSVVAMASGIGNGVVLALGHEGFFVNEALELYDNKKFGNNIVDWLDKPGKRKILVTTGHSEWYGGGNFDNFKIELENRGYAVVRFSGTLTASVLSDVGVVLIGNAWGTISQSEIDSLKDFVTNGGGILLEGLGWSWEPYNPGKTLDDYPMNKIGKIFGVRWISGYINDPTNNYNGQPIFHTFYPKIELQTIYQAFYYIQTMTDAHPGDLPSLLQNNASARTKYVNAHLLLATASMELSQASIQRQEIYVFYKNLISSYPQYFQKSIVYNKVSQSTIAWIRERVYRSFINTLIYGSELTEDQKMEVAITIALTDRYLDIWNEFSVLLLDNTGLNQKQKDFIYTFLNLIPQDLHILHSISVTDNLGTLPSPTPEITLWGKNDGVNIFNIDVGAIQENGFPADVSPKFSDVFCLVVVHEVNHVIDAYRIWKNNVLQDRKMDLIRAAGNTSMNYLRSMFPSDFFTKAPQEFFASISNQWFSDTFHTLELALTRFSNGYTEPINQFLFFADVYSLGLNQTIFYTLDTKGNITRNHVPLTRDSNNHINSLDYDGTRYMFNLNDEGNVLSIEFMTRIHDIAILNITFSKQYASINETISIYVTVQNKRDFNETFDISVNYTLILDPLIGTQTIALAPGESITLNFTWTPNATGRYEIKAYTSTIPNDTNPSDNTKITYLCVSACMHMSNKNGFKSSNSHFKNAVDG
jgi:hypothetical protein